MVADDHPFFRDGVTRGLTMSGRVEVVAEADDGREALEAIRRERPDVALVDYEMPDVDGLGVVRRPSATGCRPGCCCSRRTPTAGSCSRPWRRARPATSARTRGAPRSSRRCWTWRAGRRSCPPELAAGLAGEIRLRAQSSGPALCERERQVLQAFARGLSVPQVAAELFIGVSTVKTHTQRLYEKLGVSDRAAAVAEGMRRGLVE